MKIAILDDYQDAVKQLSCFKLIAGFDVKILTRTEKNPILLAKAIADRDVIVLIREKTLIDEQLLDLLPHLKLISQTGKVSHHIDINACNKYGVKVVEGSGSPIAPAELAWALIMNSLRLLPQAINDMKQGKWQTNIGSTVYGKTIGIWGYGKIGQRIAAYAKAFGADICVWGSEKSREQATKDGFNAATSKTAFFETVDVVTLHLRLNDHTREIVKATDLMRMKTNALLVNTARAELIEKGALMQYLKRDKPGFAALDVYDDEPLYDNHNELLQLSNVLCSPHLGYVEKNSYELYFRQAFENILSFIEGNPVHMVNP